MMRSDAVVRDIAIFWDNENVRCPKGIKASLVAAKVRAALADHGQIKKQNLYYDSRKKNEQKTDRANLDSTGWSLIDCPTRNAKESCDKKIIADVLEFAYERCYDLRRPCCVVVISSDGDYAYVLNKLRNLEVKTIVMFKPLITAPVLLESADIALPWDDVLGLPPSNDDDDDDRKTKATPKKKKDTTPKATTRKMKKTMKPMKQSYIIVEAEVRLRLLLTFINMHGRMKKVMVFCSSSDAVKFYPTLLSNFDVAELHGEGDLAKFNDMSTGVVFCTDGAARGLDLSTVDLIIQYDPPCDIHEYITRLKFPCRSFLPVLFLMKSERGFLKYLKDANVDLVKYKVPRNDIPQLYNLPGLLERNFDIHDAAFYAYHSYLLAYAEHTHQAIFNVSSLDLTAISTSFGFADPPSGDLRLSGDDIRRTTSTTKRKLLIHPSTTTTTKKLPRRGVTEDVSKIRSPGADLDNDIPSDPSAVDVPLSDDDAVIDDDDPSSPVVVPSSRPAPVLAPTRPSLVARRRPDRFPTSPFLGS